ncbi:MAG: hypothetical protein V1774_00040 [Candidatus Eisenbacteria bacterium]
MGRTRIAPRETRAGITLVETMVATMIVALLAGGTASSGHLILSTLREGDRAWTVTELGTALLSEISSLPFDDPQLGAGTPGPETGEWSPGGSRALFDDVDDYTVWTLGNALQSKDGTPIQAPGYARAVTIDYVDGDDFESISAAPTDYKRIAVSVYMGGELLGTFVTVRAQGGRDVDFDG